MKRESHKILRTHYYSRDFQALTFEIQDQNLKAVILTESLGKGLGPSTDGKTRQMIEIAGRPIVAHQIEWLSSHDVNEVVICLGQLKTVVFDQIGSGRKFRVSVGYSVEDEPLGSGGTIRNARALIDGDKFLVVKGNVLTNINPWNLAISVDGHDSLGSIASVPLQCPYGIIKIRRRLGERFH